MTVRAVLFDLGETLIFEAHIPGEEQVFAVMADRLRPLFQTWGIAGDLDVIAFLRDLHDALDVAQRQRRARRRRLGGADGGGLAGDGDQLARAGLATLPGHARYVAPGARWRSPPPWYRTAATAPTRGGRCWRSWASRKSYWTRSSSRPI